MKAATVLNSIALWFFLHGAIPRETNFTWKSALNQVQE